MKRVVFLLLLTFALVGISIPAGATAITFNEAGLNAGVGPDPYFTGTTKGTLLTNQLASFGVLFSIASGGAAYISNDTYLGPAGSSAMSGNYLVVNTVPYDPNKATTLHATFVDPVTGLATTASNVSAVVSDWNVIPDPRVTVNAYDLLGNLLQTLALHDFASTLSFSSDQIARLDFVDNGGDGHIIDNFNFTLNPTSVPEPGTLALLSAGLVFVGARRRRHSA